MVNNIRILGKKVDLTKHGNIVSYDEIMKEIEGQKQTLSVAGCTAFCIFCQKREVNLVI
jgi:hypothetical protein